MAHYWYYIIIFSIFKICKRCQLTILSLTKWSTMNILLSTSKLTTKRYWPFFYCPWFYCNHYSNTLWVKITCRGYFFYDCVHLLQRFYQDVEKVGFLKFHQLVWPRHILCRSKVLITMSVFTSFRIDRIVGCLVVLSTSTT